MSNNRFLLYAILFSVLVLLPYGLAFWQTSGEVVFQGFLLNPIDGNSYLAKMYQGWRGDWTFKLPYTADPGDGAYLFVFYLFLGHLARWTGLSLILTYHLARWLGALFLLWTLDIFYHSHGFRGTSKSFAFVLSAFGAGMGWLVFLSGSLTADFWVAEAYPFLSAYANPHFPLGLGLLLILLRGDPEKIDPDWLSTWGTRLVVSAVALILALVSPFGVVIVLLVRGVRLLWQLLWLSRTQPDGLVKLCYQNRQIRSELLDIFVILIFAMPVLIYDLVITRLQPVLSAWNTQNLTPSPPVWDVLIAFSPAILLAALAVFSRLRKAGWRADTLVAWLLVGLVLMYFPWSLQRRFIMGLYVPIAGLAVPGLEALAGRIKSSKRLLFAGIFLLSIPSPLMVILAGMHGVQTQDPSLFLSAGEVECLDWVEANTQPDALILASPQMGLYIPARTGRKVLYGHPFETAQAEKEQAIVQKLMQQSGEFEQASNVLAYLQQRGVDYLFWGAREAKLGEFPDWPGLTRVCSSGEASLYQLPLD